MGVHDLQLTRMAGPADPLLKTAALSQRSASGPSLSFRPPAGGSSPGPRPRRLRTRPQTHVRRREAPDILLPGAGILIVPPALFPLSREASFPPPLRRPRSGPCRRSSLPAAGTQWLRSARGDRGGPLRVPSRRVVWSLPRMSGACVGCPESPAACRVGSQPPTGGRRRRRFAGLVEEGRSETLPAGFRRRLEIPLERCERHWRQWTEPARGRARSDLGGRLHREERRGAHVAPTGCQECRDRLRRASLRPVPCQSGVSRAPCTGRSPWFSDQPGCAAAGVDLQWGGLGGPALSKILSGACPGPPAALPLVRLWSRWPRGAGELLRMPPDPVRLSMRTGGRASIPNPLQGGVTAVAGYAMP